MNNIISKCLSSSGIKLWGLCEYTPQLLLNGKKLPKHIASTASTVIVCAFPWFAGIPDKRNVSLYAAARDYHTIAGKMLEDAVEKLEKEFEHNFFKHFVDASPINEVKAGLLSGVGMLGLNRQLISKEHGSMIFIGEIVTDLNLNAKTIKAKSCEKCMACVNACPTGALTVNGFDISRCRSFITQKKGSLSEWEAEQVSLGKLAWGCDICTLCCPHNKSLDNSYISEFTKNLTPMVTDENIDALLPIHPYGWRGREVLSRNLKLISGE